MNGGSHPPDDRPRSRRDPVRGDLIGGHRIERPLGAGAMGTVWLAEHVTLGRRVALKILADGLAHDVSFQDRFMREARLAARLDHPNVVTVYDAGTDPAGLWLSMQYVRGEDLRRRLNRVAAAAGKRPARPADAPAPGRSSSPFKRPSSASDDPTLASSSSRADAAPPGGLPPEEAVRVLEGVAAGLDHAHSRGILHRDVKPGNVLLEAADDEPATPAPPAGGTPARRGAPDDGAWAAGDAAPGPAPAPDRSGGPALPPFGQVLLADFGLTKELEEDGDLTQTGMLLGSADSVAPEQIEGREADARVDVYALGSLLYVALTGAPPFPGATMAKLFAHVNGDRPRAGAAFPELRPFDAVIAAGMAKDPSARPETAGELAAMARDALDRLDVDPQATVAFPGPTPPRDRRPPPRPRPTPPAPGVPLAPRMRDETTAAPIEPRPGAQPDDDAATRVAPASARARPPVGAGPPPPRASSTGAPRPEYRTPPPANRPVAVSAAGGPPRGPGGDPSRPGDDGPKPWIVPALVVGGLVIALAVVLALAFRGGGDDDGTTTSAREPEGTTTQTESTTGEEPTGTTTDEGPPATTDTAAPGTTTGEQPANEDEIDVQGGGTIAAGGPTRDPAAGQPLAGTGTAADYVAGDGSWRTLVARPTAGWGLPTLGNPGSSLERLRQSGPGGRLILVDHTPRQPASFDTSNVLETRQIGGTAFGDVTGYRFKDARIGSIPECRRRQCVDVPLNQGENGPGWGVLVAAPTAAEAWATAERVVRATGP